MREVGTAEQTVTVRYWAAAREAAGVDSEQFALGADATVGDVVAAAVGAHPDLDRIARVATFLVDGRAARRDTALGAGASLEVLPPFAGG
jgi:molybdopterin converting factor small subunit